MQQLLKTYFGYEAFRPLQEEIISHTAAKKEAIVIMATGSGKSLCYQLPALTFPGLTLVISPLIALMKDQVDALQNNGIAAAFMNSTLSIENIQAIERRLRKGEIKILYVAPERLALTTFQSFLKELPIDLIAIDEAHCISEWGHDFRPEYRNLKTLRTMFPLVPLIALTATATERVRLDISAQLNLQNAPVFLSSFNRKNLAYRILPKKKALPKLIGLLGKYKNESVIIYCFSRKNTEDLALALQKENFNAAAYHAGLETEKRKKIQEEFIRDEISIIVATIAFGMGIDKPNVRLVVHFDLPKSIEGYYQETGRAGRDGLPSECVLFYSYGDKIKHDFFINQISDHTQREATNTKLTQMIEYAQSKLCRRAYLLEYFGEDYDEENCQNCDTCLMPKENFDATEITWKILSAVLRLQERFGVSYIIDILLGKETKKVLERGHQHLSVFGIAKNQNASELQYIIDLLIAKKILQKTSGEYPVLKVTNEGKILLNKREKITLTKPIENLESLEENSIQKEPRIKAKKKTSQELPDYDHELFELLRKLRKTLADKKEVPPFVIFSDVSLREMAHYLPQTAENFRLITGVGEFKLAEYGEAFLEVICEYAKSNNLKNQFTT